MESRLHDPRKRLPEASRTLARFVEDLGRPSPTTPARNQVFPAGYGSGIIEELIRNMPGPEPALQQLAERRNRDANSEIETEFESRYAGLSDDLYYK